MEKMIKELESGDFGSTGRSAAKMLRSVVDTRDQYKALCEQKDAELAEKQKKIKELSRQIDMLWWVMEAAKPGDKIYASNEFKVEEATINSISYDEENKLLISISFKCSHNCQGCPFEEPWEDQISEEGGCDGEYGNMEIPISKLGVTFFNDRALAEKVQTEFWE